MELVYSEECPFCRRIAAAVDALDPGGLVTLTPIESKRGRWLVNDHHGEFVHSPHLFTNSMVYFGIKPVARQLAIQLPRVTAIGLLRRFRRGLPAPGREEAYGHRD